MRTLTANDAKRNFEELLTSAHREPIKISMNGKDVAVIMSIKDYGELETMKADYIKHCFESAKHDLTDGEVIDGDNSSV
ncbi:type II toxin-antitoxin system Phd/YefM family antitoxin [Vibrio breoganii]